MKPRLILMGTPGFSVPAFSRLFESGAFDIAGVITQPDKPSGRGMKLTACPVKILAEKHACPVSQPEILKGISLAEGKLSTTRGENRDFVEFVNARIPIDALIVIAYGKILPKALIDLPRSGAVNVHASLLPRWRGAAPIHHAIFAGDRVTGVGLMKLEQGLDTGPVYAERKIEIDGSDTFGSLHDRLSQLGAQLLAQELPGVLNGELVGAPQDEAGVTVAGKWEKSDLRVRWGDSAEVTVRRVRASAPSPGARASLRGDLVKIFRARVSTEKGKLEPGTVVRVTEEGIVVAGGGGQYITLDEVQFAGRTRVSAAEVARGRLLAPGDRFSEESL